MKNFRNIQPRAASSDTTESPQRVFLRWRQIYLLFRRHTTITAKSAKSLFDKLGGTKSIEAVVDEFYKRVLADTELKPFFAETNMTWLRMRQVQFLTQALGGPALYKGKGMKEAHAKVTIGQHHFDLVAMHLVGTLKSLSVAQAEIDAVVSAVAPLAKDIVSK